MQPMKRLRFHITTADLPATRRLSDWQEIYGRNITYADIEPIGTGDFHADFTFHLLPSVTIARGSRSAAHYRVTRDLAKRNADAVLLSWVRSGTARMVQFEEESNVEVGSAVIASSTDPFTGTMLMPGSFTTLALPRRTIAAISPNYVQYFGRAIGAESAALRLLSRYVDLMLAEDRFADAGICRTVSDHVVDLAALTLGARGDAAIPASQRGARAARLATIKFDVLRNLGDLALSAEAVAARNGVSARHVRRLFEEDGSSFSAYVLAERLDKARNKLGDRRFAQATIARVAHECGFGDISYFNRRFRARFGQTPSDARRRTEDDGADHLQMKP